MLLLLIFTFVINVLSVVTDNAKVTIHGPTEIKHSRLPTHIIAPPVKDKLIHNASIYIDKTENILRVPDMKKNNAEHQTKRKNLKKSPKRTIQKIIKKSRSRRKLYLNQATSMPTKAPMTGDELEKFYAQEEMLQRNENVTTIQVNQKKKKKWPVSRYPMPFQYMASKKDSYRRNKRSEDREDMFILTDLDEIKFLDGGQDENVVNAHIKKYW